MLNRLILNYALLIFLVNYTIVQCKPAEVGEIIKKKYVLCGI